MSVVLAEWVVHPMTLTLFGVGAGLLFWLLEVQLHSLAEMGNVRFQGVLADHPRLFVFPAGRTLHLSQLLDALRWVQVACLGLLWLIIFRWLQDRPGLALTASIVLPLVIMAASRVMLGVLSERGVTNVLRIMRFLVLPLLWLIVRLGKEPSVPASELEEEVASEREIQAYIDVGQAAGIFEGEEGEFLESLVDFFDTTVREVMTPRTTMVALAEEASFDELLSTFAETRKSRIPIYRETIDQVIGVVHVKNVLTWLMSDQRPTVGELANDCLVVPESKRLGELLHDFQLEHQQLAIVVDEYGGTSGLVTFEDILEEIVGEIQDEHDPKEPPEWQEMGPGMFRLQGRAPIELLKELFSVEVSDDEVDTIGGLVFSRHGTVPEPGTTVNIPSADLQFTVEEMEGRRIVSVTVQHAGGRSTGTTESR